MSIDGDGEAQGRGPLQSVLNAVKVLQSFSIAEPQLGVTEIARRVELHKSTVSRILSTLELAGMVSRDAVSGRFGLGLGIITAAGPLLAHLDVRRLAYPVLQRLSEQTTETAALTVWNGSESIVVEQIESTRLVKHTTPLGARFTKAASASVQVFLSHLEPAQVRRLLAQGLIQLPEGVTADAYAASLRDVVAAGHAWNKGNTDPEELSVAAPILDHRGQVAAVLLISAPRARVSEFQLRDIVERLDEASVTLSATLGYSAPGTGPAPSASDSVR